MSFLVREVVSEDSPHQHQNGSEKPLVRAGPASTEREPYPFVGEYICKKGLIGRVKIEDNSEGKNITFYRQPNAILAKSSYGCGFTAHPEWKVWFLNLQDPCKALINDSHGYYDSTMLTATYDVVSKGLLVIPNTVTKIVECEIVK
ncbi:hypothetical protein Pmar_PMAR013319 [Perkinsus marinus ATCC 50983]|uniref:Uncharacterized protein n=1 Tax=Perkinsus marinus (strain ATCC 50983 / TXsc) TaxID=423536 RepID=C5LVI0_PERM5|nr:hypothetical protein Pmar_PMAR013319 [Perkinsus marinus ATCC 50983]EEQ99267.1 hypothetical protein Pmar_PMAR013319 [Perkinsus marinus ATCC 50983]|eukprot:XP_002766550.1 hypothetical protein Pmar_PMAR013319 [Perkinsus marinus ATCC 50983]